MDLIAISTVETGLQTILGSIAFIGCMIIVGVFVLLIASIGNSHNDTLKMNVLILVIAGAVGIGSIWGYFSIDRHILYHYVVTDYSKLESVLPDYNIYSNNYNVYELIKK